MRVSPFHPCGEGPALGARLLPVLRGLAISGFYAWSPRPRAVEACARGRAAGPAPIVPSPHPQGRGTPARQPARVLRHDLRRGRRARRPEAGRTAHAGERSSRRREAPSETLAAPRGAAHRPTLSARRTPSTATSQPAAPNRVWAGDITYVRTWEGWLYLESGHHRPLLAPRRRLVDGRATCGPTWSSMRSPWRSVRGCRSPDCSRTPTAGRQYTSDDYQQCAQRPRHRVQTMSGPRQLLGQRRRRELLRRPSSASWSTDEPGQPGARRRRRCPRRHRGLLQPATTPQHTRTTLPRRLREHQPAGLT